MRTIVAAGLVMALVGSAAAPARAAEPAEQQKLVDEARALVEHLRDDRTLGVKARDLIHRARAVLIIPELVKAGFIFGGQGGSGVLLARDAKGKWGYPCFYELGGGSFGLQIGGQVSKVVLIVMNDRALDNLLKNEVKFGAGAGATVAKVTADTEASKADADIYSIAESEGFFAGATVEGASTSPNSGRNKAYYGREVSAEDIILRATVKNAGADALRDTLAKF